MDDSGFALFETALGHCGIAWGPAGIIGTLLPEADPAATRARLARRFGAPGETAPTEMARSAMRATAAHLGGARLAYAGVTLDFGRVGAWAAAV